MSKQAVISSECYSLNLFDLIQLYNQLFLSLIVARLVLIFLCLHCLEVKVISTSKMFKVDITAFSLQRYKKTVL